MIRRSSGRGRSVRVQVACLGAVLVAVGLTAGVGGRTVAAAASVPTLDLKVLLISNGSSGDPTTAAWESALGSEGVPYTLVNGAGATPSETVTLPALSSGTTGFYNGVVIADDPADFASGQLTALDTYESSFGVRQVDGYAYPTSVLGLTEASGGALDGTTGTLTSAGLAAFPSLAGTVTFDTGTYGYGATVNSGAPFTPLMTNAAGDVLAGVYQHPGTDPQAGVSELELSFDYNASQLQWLLLAPSLINWVTQDSHLGMDRNYIAMDIDDTFTPDNAWSIALHDNDYSDADSLRMDPADVITAADWSNPVQEGATTARPAGEPSTPFRLDQLFNYGGTVEYQDGALDLPGEPAACTTGVAADGGTCGPDPLLAQFQATDPATGKPWADDFGWISHTYDTPYLDAGCATQDYIEAELNENTTDITAAPGTTPGTGGLGLAKQEIAAGSIDVANPLGTYDPQVFVPGNHSGFADLEPGTPGTVDPPDLDEADASTTGGSMAAGTYEYAVTDQFNGSDSTSTDQSQAYVTDGQQGDLAPVVVTGSAGSVALVWQAICHAANYIIYRAPVTGGVAGSWTEIGTYATPDSATLPDNSSGDSTPASAATVCQGPSPDPTSCAGELELTFTDTGSDTSTPPAGVTYLDTPMPAGWTPPVVEDANELPWEQNPYFSAALTAVGITTVGADASKPYPNPPDDEFGIGANYTGAEYAAGQPFTDGTSEVAPRHPINVFYNVATNAQELDEYNTLYDADYPDSQCKDTSTVTCSTTPFTFSQVVTQVVSGMFQNMLANNPEINYVHQTNLMGTPPYSSILPPAGYVPAATAQTGTDGDGTLYEVLNPLIAEYSTYFNTNTPYVQLTMGGIGNTLADQTAWSNIQAQTTPTVTATETNGVVTITNTGTTAAEVPVTVPPGTTGATLESYGGELSNWLNVAAGGSLTLTEHVAPAITSATAATATVGAAFTFTVDTTGLPAPALTESGALPSGITFTDNANGTATIAGTAATGTAGSYPITITATNTTGTATQTFTLTVLPAGALYTPLGPVRVLDTRNGTGAPEAAVGAGGTISLQVEGVDGVPATGVTAVVLNVTATDTTASSYVTVYPDGTTRPTASNLNFTAGETIPNLVVVPVDADGKVDFYNHVGRVDLVADLQGYYSTSGSAYDSIGPVRVLDTRNGTGAPQAAVGANGTISLQVEGVAGVPATGVTAVVLNVTATDTTASSYVTVYPDGTTRPTASDLNFTAGETIPNLVLVPVGADGKVDFYNHTGSADLVADLAGYYTATGSSFSSIGPVRVLDTRNGTGGFSSPVGGGGTISLQVEGVDGVPATGVTAVVLNVTATNPTASSYVTVYPDGTTKPTASSLNFTAGETIPNLVVVPVGADGKVDFYNHVGTVNLVADLAGYYTS